MLLVDISLSRLIGTAKLSHISKPKCEVRTLLSTGYSSCLGPLEHLEQYWAEMAGQLESPPPASQWKTTIPYCLWGDEGTIKNSTSWMLGTLWLVEVQEPFRLLVAGISSSAFRYVCLLAKDVRLVAIPDQQQGFKISHVLAPNLCLLV